MNRLLLPSYTASSGNFSSFAGKIDRVSYWCVSSRLESSLILYELTLSSYPDSYLRRLHLRMPWFIGLTQNASFARLEVSNRFSRMDSSRFGPFRNRDTALLYQEQLLGLHQIRRCTETLLPSPDHPGCIYGEMNQCLRPCQCAVSPDEYATETARVSEFLRTAGKSSAQPLAAARDRAVAELDFEQAALAHKRLEKVQAAIAVRDKVVTSVNDFHGIAVTRSHHPDAVTLWPMCAGYWQPSITFRLQQEARSLDSSVRECLQAALAFPVSDGNRLEHMALFSRWFYSSWRDGQWFPFETLARLNYRRLVKAISDLAKPAPAQSS